MTAPATPTPSRVARIAGLFRAADDVVPRSGWTSSLTIFTAAAMGFLAVFALALVLASGRLASSWSAALSQSATVRVSAPEGSEAAQRDRVLAILATTPGVASARALEADETRRLLEPWFGPDLPVETLPIPMLIAIDETASGFDAEGLRLRLAAEVPGAVLDDHTRWRRPLVEAAERLRSLGLVSLALIGAVTAAMIALAAQASLAANARIIQVLRLVGARDSYIARAFVRRFTLRALGGAAVGVLAGLGVVTLLPSAGAETGFPGGFGFHGAGWVAVLAIAPLAGIVAFAATRFAAFRTLRGVQ